ncbi:MAG: hypothetical protein KGL39_30800 [Patescibacteria group bacterium]|nr:hypothetical protein [Patescibacteria group bacterium]
MSEIKLIMEKVGGGNTPADFMFWACRGEGRGCHRNKFRSRQKHCDDCVIADNPKETLGELQKRINRGDA